MSKEGPGRSGSSAGSPRGDGEPVVDPDLADQLYTELRRLAAAAMRDERAMHTLQPTALVHEAYLRLSGERVVERAHFLALAARTMRRVLVDHSRRRQAQKRAGEGQRITLRDSIALVDESRIDLLDLEQALAALSDYDERKARVVELRFFGGLSCAETAPLLGIAPKTVEADWYMARAWLRHHLKDRGGGSRGS